MRPIAFFLQLSLLTIGIISTHAQEVKQVDITFTLNEYNIIYNGENTYSIETLNQHYYYPEDPSLPAIPLKSIRVLVPNGSELLDYQIETEEEIVGEDIILTKAPILIPTKFSSPRENAESEFNGVFPGKPVEYEITMIQCGITCFSFTVSPFRYDGHKRKLTFIKRIKLRVNYRICEENKSIVRQDEAVIQALKKRFVNQEDLERFYPPSTMSVLKSANERIDYLIVTSEEFKSEFRSLLEWKTRKGLAVDIVTMEEIAEKYSDATIQLKIKRCLKDYYQNNALQWVLLAGDHDIVPVQHCYAETNLGFLTAKDNSIPADLFYACLDGRFDWNSVVDDKIGQIYFDYVDKVPEIDISRIPVRTREQVKTFVNKTLNYETGKSQTDHNGKLLLAGVKLRNFWDGKSDSHNRSELIFDKYISGKFKGEKFSFFDSGTDFPEGDNYPVSSSNLFDLLNRGYGIFHFSGHGNPRNFHMESGPDYNINDASVLQSPVAGLFITNSCKPSAFDLREPSLAEAFLRNPNGGCVAFLGSSRDGYSNSNPSNVLGPSLNFNASFFKYLFEEQTEPGLNSFASIVSRVKTDFADCGSFGGAYHYLLYSINALGDPEMPLFTTNPNTFKSVRIDQLGNSITVKTGGVMSTICVTGHDIGMGYQQVVENVSSHTFQDVPDSLQVTITAPNYIPYRYFNPCQNPTESVTGIAKGLNSSISIYPNPTNGLISFYAQGLEPYSIKIISLNGQLLHSIDSAEREMKIDLSDYQKGIYLVTVKSRDYMWTEKIIKL
jgi:hypothetical protein